MIFKSWIFWKCDLLKIGSIDNWIIWNLIFWELDLLKIGSFKSWIFWKVDILKSGSFEKGRITPLFNVLNADFKNLRYTNLFMKITLPPHKTNFHPYTIDINWILQTKSESKLYIFLFLSNLSLSISLINKI